MLFTPDNATKVMNGTKTQTRRPQGETDEGLIYDLETKTTPRTYSVVFRNGRKVWEIGKTYAVQPGRGKPSIGRILLKSIRRERVNEISEEDAKAEGVEPDIDTIPFYGEYKDPFRRLWNSIYSGGMAFETGPMVWALEFEKVNSQE